MAANQSVVSVDPDRLDQEWVGQASLYLKYAEAEADARHAHAEAKAGLELVEARLSLAVRSTPSEYELPDKPTEGAIKAAITCAAEYKQAVGELNAAKHKLDLLAATTSALDHRRKALENLVQLEVMAYRSDPRPPRGGDAGVADAQKTAARKRR